jgi:hypothetical protein
MYVLLIVVCTFSIDHCVVMSFFDLRILITPLVSSNSSCTRWRGLYFEGKVKQGYWYFGGKAIYYYYWYFRVYQFSWMNGSLPFEFVILILIM